MKTHQKIVIILVLLALALASFGLITGQPASHAASASHSVAWQSGDNQNSDGNGSQNLPTHIHPWKPNVGWNS